MPEPDVWFVKVDGKVRGPFPVHVLASMKQRGRLGPNTMISADRGVWVPISTLGGEFDEPRTQSEVADAVNLPAVAPLPAAIPPAAGNPMSNTPDASRRCFYSVDGIVHGPIPLHTLRDRAAAGSLAATDAVWIEGQSQWMPAGQIPLLTFQGRGRRTSNWLRENPALSTCLVALGLVLFIGPSWYVVGLARHGEREIREAQEQQRAALAKAEEDANREMDRLRDDAKDLRDREERLLNQRLQITTQLETVRLQYTTLRAAKVRDEEVENRFANLEADLRSMDDKIEQNREEQRQVARAQEERERLRAQEQASRDYQSNRELERIRRETERGSDELERIRREEEKQTRELRERP